MSVLPAVVCPSPPWPNSKRAQEHKRGFILAKSYEQDFDWPKPPYRLSIPAEQSVPPGGLASPLRIEKIFMILRLGGITNQCREVWLAAELRLHLCP